MLFRKLAACEEPRFKSIIGIIGRCIATLGGDSVFYYSVGPMARSEIMFEQIYTTIVAKFIKLSKDLKE